MKIQIYILMLILNIGCTGQSEDSNAETIVSKEIVNKLGQLKKKNPIHNLKELRRVITQDEATGPNPPPRR